MQSSYTFNAMRPPQSGFNDAPQDRPHSSGESRNTKTADITLFPSHTSEYATKATSQGATATGSRPKTSHARLQPVEEPGVPPIPPGFNCTPPIMTAYPPSGNYQQETNPSSEANNKLSSYPSISSLKSQSSDSSPRKKRKRLLPFKSKFIGAWKDGVSNAKSAESLNEVDDVASLTAQMSHLPANLKPAAAKRLGVTCTETKNSTRMPQTLLVRTGQSSVVHSRCPSWSDATKPAIPKRDFKRRSRRFSPAAVLEPAPEISTQNNALDDNDTFHEYETQNLTFYASSSDSEDDDVKYSSGYSYPSSHTSYNTTSPLSIDIWKTDEQLVHTSKAQATLIGVPSHNNSHVHQSSTSSSGSCQVGGPTSPSSRTAPFSKLFSRQSQNQSITRPPSGFVLSRDNEGESQPGLEAIREDSPLPSVHSNPMAQEGHMQELSTSSREYTPFRTEFVSTASPTKPSQITNVPKHDDYNDRGLLSKLQHCGVALQLPDLPLSDSKSARPLSLAVTKQSEAFISAVSAEAVILHIFETIDNFKDLFACARLNKGFYKVFKRHELRLMKNTLRNHSPAQWEHREASPKVIISSFDGPKADYTPTSYVQFQRRDAFVLASLKSVILARCQISLRSDTINALTGRDPVRSERIDDAFWRIWTFCTIFGAEKGREYDIQAQLDWLRGGVATQRPTSHASNSTHGTRRPTTAPADENESFGRGNFGGLTVDELQDIKELWTCIRTLLRDTVAAGRCWQARAYGVFQGHNVSEGDTVNELSLLEEWTFYLISLGPNAIVDLAVHSNSSSDEMFSTAESMGWTKWGLPLNGLSRSTFLQDAVTQLYEEKMSKTKQVSYEQVQAKRRSKGHELAAQLRQEKRRSVNVAELFAQDHDQSIGVWLEWMAKVEGAEATAKTNPSDTVQDKSSKRDTQKSAASAASAPRPATRSRSNSALSLFPTTYTRPGPNGTPRITPISTPRRSRNNSRSNSIVQQTRPALKPQAPPIEEQHRPAPHQGDQKQQLFTPRLSVCQEA